MKLQSMTYTKRIFAGKNTQTIPSEWSAIKNVAFV